MRAPCRKREAKQLANHSASGTSSTLSRPSSSGRGTCSGTCSGPVGGESGCGSGGALAMTAPMDVRSEEHTSELQSLMRISYAVFCLKKKKNHTEINYKTNTHYTTTH